jgi:hypothetical protein
MIRMEYNDILWRRWKQGFGCFRILNISHCDSVAPGVAVAVPASWLPYLHNEERGSLNRPWVAPELVSSETAWRMAVCRCEGIDHVLLIP